MKAARLYDYDPQMNVELKIEEIPPPTMTRSMTSADAIKGSVGFEGSQVMDFMPHFSAQ